MFFFKLESRKLGVSAAAEAEYPCIASRAKHPEAVRAAGMLFFHNENVILEESDNFHLCDIPFRGEIQICLWGYFTIQTPKIHYNTTEAICQRLDLNNNIVILLTNRN